MAAPCVTCLQDTNNKAKPGIFPCLGCKQMFCTQHVAFHRQQLANELDLVIGERNELQDLFDHQENLPDTTFHMGIIDKWMKKTIEQVYQAADKARQHLIRVAQEHRIIITDKFGELSKQINDMRENDDFFEQDIANMKDKCSHLKAAINQIDLKMNTADVNHTLDAAIAFHRTEQTTAEVSSNVEKILKHHTLYKQITLPHDGTMCLGDGFALIKNQTDYTIVKFHNNSMRSISFETLDGQVYCWSSDYEAYFSKNCISTVRGYNNPIPTNTIKFIPVLNISDKCDMVMKNEGELAAIACFGDSLLTVSNIKTNSQVIEGWRFINERWNQEKPSVELVSRWHPPLSCSTDESIKRIVFNDEHIVLAIQHSKNFPTNRVEFRTRGMLVLGRVFLDQNVDFVSISLLPMEDGWILGQKKIQNESRDYTLIDNSFHEHEQKILSTQNIEHIAVIRGFGRDLLAVYQKTSDIHLSTDINQKLVLNFYDMQPKNTVRRVRK